MKSIPGVILISCMMLAFSLGAQAQHHARIKAIKPARVYPGDPFDLIGGGFGDRQGNGRTVMIYMNEYGHSERYKLQVLKWSDNRIRVESPDTASPGVYSAGIYFGDE